MITGPELGLIMSGNPHDLTTAHRWAQRLGMPPCGHGHRRYFTLGQVVATLAVADVIGSARRALLDVVPDLVDLERARWIAVCARDQEVAWGPDPESALADLAGDCVYLVSVDAALATIADRIGRPVAVAA